MLGLVADAWQGGQEKVIVSFDIQQRLLDEEGDYKETVDPPPGKPVFLQ